MRFIWKDNHCGRRGDIGKLQTKLREDIDIYDRLYNQMTGWAINTITHLWERLKALFVRTSTNAHSALKFEPRHDKIFLRANAKCACPEQTGHLFWACAVHVSGLFWHAYYACPVCFEHAHFACAVCSGHAHFACPVCSGHVQITFKSQYLKNGLTDYLCTDPAEIM